MKSIIYILAGFLLLTTAPNYTLAQSDFKEEFVIPLSKPGEIGLLKVDLRGGSISISGYSGNEVVVNAEIINHPTKEDDEKKSPDGLTRIPSNTMNFSIAEKNNKVYVEYNDWKRDMKLDIKVPEKFNLALDSHNGKMITVEGVSGEMEVESHNGHVELNNIAGSAIVSSHNGHIVANFKSVKSDTPMAFSSYNGKIDITLPANTAINTKLQTRKGEIYTDFDMEIIKVAPQKHSRNENGIFEIKIDDWVHGKVNGGGSEMMMKTRNGNIYLRKRK